MNCAINMASANAVIYNVVAIFIILSSIFLKNSFERCVALGDAGTAPGLLTQNASAFAATFEPLRETIKVETMVAGFAFHLW